jgi:hypothetical protein
MSVGPLAGLAASIAGSSLAQTKGSEVERGQIAASNQERRAQNEIRAENAAGIGEADGQDHETSERDADGRRLWEEPAGKTPTAPSGEKPVPPQSKDSTGQRGTLLDLTG